MSYSVTSPYISSRGRGAKCRLCAQRVCSVCLSQGAFPVRKRTGTLRIWRAPEREPIWGSGGGAPSGVQGQSPWSGSQGAKPPEAEGILLPKRANLSLSFK